MLGDTPKKGIKGDYQYGCVDKHVIMQFPSIVAILKGNLRNCLKDISSARLLSRTTPESVFELN